MRRYVVVAHRSVTHGRGARRRLRYNTVPHFRTREKVGENGANSQKLKQYFACFRFLMIPKNHKIFSSFFFCQVHRIDHIRRPPNHLILEMDQHCDEVVVFQNAAISLLFELRGGRIIARTLPAGVRFQKEASASG